jgi:hypothetical protein
VTFACCMTGAVGWVGMSSVLQPDIIAAARNSAINRTDLFMGFLLSFHTT